MNMSSLDWIILYICVVIVLLFIVGLLRKFYVRKYKAEQKYAVLELTPPIYSAKSPNSTGHLFSVLYNLGNSHSFKEKLINYKHSFSFEVIATRNDGIRFITYVLESDVKSLQLQFSTYLPEVKFKVIKDPLRNIENGSHVLVSEYKQSRHFAFPLVAGKMLGQKDPIAYLTGAMTKLEANDTIAYQLLISPTVSREAGRIRRNLAVGKDPGLSKFRNSNYVLYFLAIIKVVIIPLRLVMGFISEIANSGNYNTQRPMTRKTPAVMELDSSLNDKLGQSLFLASIRTLVSGNDKARISQTESALEAALGAFHVPGYQGLVVRKSLFNNRAADKYLDLFLDRGFEPADSKNCILSVSEIASLYHFPYGHNVNPESLVRSHSRTLPSPVLRKEYSDTKKYDVILGVNKHHGSETPLGLTAEERERHVYILGGTGNGKTTMLEYAIVQDIKNGKGVAVIDPHGDLAESLIRYIPKDRIKDVIYFNPSDISHPIGLNLLEQPKGLDKDSLLIERDFITESIVSVFRKIFSDDDSGGHRIEHFLRNAIHTAFTVPDATLFTVYKLLTNARFRRSVVNQLEDDDLIDFWKGEFNNAGDYQKVKMSSGVNAKLGRFSRSVVTRRILEQPVSTIDFDDIIQNKKILICNFPKGKIGEDTSALLGTSVLTKLQLAALRRSRISKDIRTPFYLYVDEFQNLATSSFSQVLSEARKYKLFITIAEQTTAQQQDKRLTEVILANVGTVISFRTGSTQDEKLLLPLFSPSISVGELSNLEAYNFYARIMAIKPQEPVSGETLLLIDGGSSAVADNVIKESRKQYAIQYKDNKHLLDKKLVKSNSFNKQSNEQDSSRIAKKAKPI